tara:strand:+ start:955 stop:1641 length:687 start_codon:yes stop_codon:yes gene_type:complete
MSSISQNKISHWWMSNDDGNMKLITCTGDEIEKLAADSDCNEYGWLNSLTDCRKTIPKKVKKVKKVKKLVILKTITLADGSVASEKHQLAQTVNPCCDDNLDTKDCDECDGGCCESCCGAEEEERKPCEDCGYYELMEDDSINGNICECNADPYYEDDCDSQDGKHNLDEFGHCIRCCECKKCIKVLEEILDEEDKTCHTCKKEYEVEPGRGGYEGHQCFECFEIENP